MSIKNISAIFLAGIFLSGSSAVALTPQMTNALILSTGLSSLKTNLNNANVSLSDSDTSDISFGSIESLVRKNNQSIKGFEKTLDSINSTNVKSQFEVQMLSYYQQNSMLYEQAAGYQQSADELYEAAESTQDTATKTALEAQANAMALLAEQARASIAMNDGIISGLEESQEDAENQLKDTYASTKHQLDNAADQIVVGAQTQYITLITLQNSIDTLNRSIAAIDRSIVVMQTQLEIGMASELDLKTLQNQRQTAQSSLESLISQQKNLQASLSLTLGNEVGTSVNAESLPYISKSEINKIDYKQDLEKAMDNSYAIWQKADAARKASNEYMDNLYTTADAYEAAKIDLEATKEQTENSFKTLYESVLEKQRLLEQAEENLTFAEVNFEIAEVKLNQGIISQLQYENEKDTLESAKDAIKTAETELFTAYNTYQWGIRGVI